MMKKVLLATTAIAGAMLIGVPATLAAEKPTVKIDGYLRFEAWQVDQDLDRGDNGAPAFEMDDVEIHFTASAVADNGLEYGAYVELQEGSNTSTTGYDEANVFLAGNWGRFDLGSQDAVHNTYKVGAYAISADQDAAWDGNVLFEHGNNAAYIGTDFFNGDDSNKITYYTPTFAGFTAGVSYMPNSEAQFNSGLVDEDSNGTGFLLGGEGDMNNQLGVAVHYANTFGDFGVEADARYATAEYQTIAGDVDREEAEAYGIGAKVTFAGFSVAGSFQDLGDSGLTDTQKAAGGDTGQWWDIGVAYGTGPYKVSVIYMQSEGNAGDGNGDDEVSYLSFGANYAVAPGLDFYGTYQYVEVDDAVAADDNDVNMFMVGTRVRF